MRCRLPCPALAGALLALAAVPAARSEELPPKYRETANRGLDWLAKQQHRDGHWEANGGQFASAMTGLAGTTLPMEGSTIREGKYKDHIRRAVDWLMAHAQGNGLIGDPNAANQGLGYLYGHGFAMLFLSQVVGEEEDAERRAKLEDLLNRAVVFTHNARTSR